MFCEPRESGGNPIRQERRGGPPAWRRFFYTRPNGSFPLRDGRFVALNGPTFRLLVAPTSLGEEVAYVMMMVLHLPFAFDQIGDPLGLSTAPSGHREPEPLWSGGERDVLSVSRSVVVVGPTLVWLSAHLDRPSQTHRANEGRGLHDHPCAWRSHEGTTSV